MTGARCGCNCRPRVIGHPAAIVTADVTPHRATFDIRVVSRVTGVGHLRRLVRAVSSAPALVQTLVDQEHDLRENFEAVIESQRQFQTIIDSLPDAIIIHREGEIAYTNPSFARLLGYETALELVGRAWASLVHADDRDAATGACRFMCRDGGVVYLELSPERRTTYMGKPAGLIVARDVTERRAIEQQLAHADRMASLSTLASGLAHEINNPLTLVVNNLQLAEREGGCGREAPCSEYVRAASEGAERVSAIVRELHAFAKPPEDERPDSVDLGDVVRSSVSLARGKVRPVADLDVQLAELPAVIGSRGRVGQVVLNLLLNALHALPEERRDHNRIDVRVSREGDHAVLEVQDNGRGIPARVRGHIFEPFFTTKGVAEGTGLGLSVAHSIVTGYGGTISFVTRSGYGTTFRVTLPLAPAVAAQQAVDADAPPATTGARILLVDDEPMLLDVVAVTLREMGCEVVTATSGDEAISVIEGDARFDAIVCDIMMANGSGVDVYDGIEANRPTLLSRLVFMTGGTFRRETDEFLARISNECLSKPFGIEQLRAAVARVVQDRPT